MGTQLGFAFDVQGHLPVAFDENDLPKYDKFVLAFSGGKDSIALVKRLLDAGVPRSKMELWHHDIDGRGRTFMDWSITAAYCQEVAKALGIPIYFSWRDGGFEREMMRQDQPTATTTFELPDGTTMTVGGEGPNGTRRKFPMIGADLKTRWCSAYLKIDVMAAAIRNQARFNGAWTLILTGERGEESASRAKYKTFEPHRTSSNKRVVDVWRPIHGWSEAQVWDAMRDLGITPHPAYCLGWSRLSCMTCIFGDPNQWATIRAVFPDRFEAIASREEEIGSTVRHGLTVHAVADRGTPFPAALANPDLCALAQKHEWDGRPVLIDPANWTLPAGAFKGNAGPC